MKAIYALSADPITNGHLNIIERALKTFDHILVGIGINKNKKYTFSLSERETLTKKVLQKYGDKVSVKSYSGLLSDFAYENNIFNIIRGVRNSNDFDYEHLLFDINVGIDSGLETYIMVADKKLSHISSSAVKELQEYQTSNILDYVPMVVKQALEKRISKQLKIGVTGSIGCGKSYVTDELVKMFLFGNIQATNIDMDKIGRYILTESTEQYHIEIRKILTKKIHNNLLKDEKINLKTLKYFLFDDILSDTYYRNYFDNLMKEPTLLYIRKICQKTEGIIFINSALFAERDFTHLTNNNILLVDCEKEIQLQRLKSRNYTDGDIENRLDAQFQNIQKQFVIRDNIKESNSGKLFICNNNKENNIQEVFHQIKDLYESF